MKILKILFLLLTLHGLPIVSAFAESPPPIMNYQGRVTVEGVNFDGTGQFKFALVGGAGAETYWSNDGTSAATAVPLAVEKGLFTVLLGDTSIPNMSEPIAASVFANPDVRLRVWFNDGIAGFQQLEPDQRIASVGYAMMAGDFINTPASRLRRAVSRASGKNGRRARTPGSGPPLPPRPME